MRIQLSIAQDISYMVADCLLGGVKKLRQLTLVEPYAPILGIEGDLTTPIIAIVYDNTLLVHIGYSLTARGRRCGSGGDPLRRGYCTRYFPAPRGGRRGDSCQVHL